jgi:hypothetical protein
MFNYEMDLCSYFKCLHVLELLLFIAAIITYDICLSYMLVLFGIRIFNLFKYEGNMSLISLILQQLSHEKGKETPRTMPLTATRANPHGSTYCKRLT